jgi:hypothetical protein
MFIFNYIRELSFDIASAIPFKSQLTAFADAQKFVS